MTRPPLPLRLRRPLSALALALAVAFALPMVASAEDVMRLQGPVTDTAGVISDRADDIEAAIRRTLDDDGVQVFVLFVRTTGELSAGDYSQQTATLNSLGVDDALLLVAMDDRTDYIWVSDSLDEITDDELDAILTETLEPALRAGEEADGTIAAVEALGQAAESQAPAESPAAPGPVEPTPAPGGAGDGGGIGLSTIVALVLLAIGGWLLYRWWRARSQAPAATTTSGQPATADAPATTAPAQLTGPELRQRANALLIGTDERIRDAQQEIDFAAAQYGPGAVEHLRTAVTNAQGELAASFELRQRLDDNEPEDDPTRESTMREIVERTTRALTMLDAETAAIRELRDLERDAPAALVELPGRIEQVEGRLPATREALARLQGYAESAWRPVAGNVEEVEKGLDGARTAVTVASAAMARDDRPAVAVATREALEGVTGSTELLDAIDRVAVTVDEAERRTPSELAEADADLKAARTAIAELGQLDPGVAGRVRDVERALDAAHEAAKLSPLDPLDALRLATEAHQTADALLLAARDAVAAEDRLEAAAGSSIRTASAEVDRAATYIASRRPGVGEGARTRLAEAQRHLQTAASVVGQDPQAAIDGSKRAQQLAREAYQLASSDFSGWDSGGPGWGQPGGDPTAEILGQILGGVIGGVIRSGAGGGWGGSPWGAPGGRRGGGGGLPDLGDLSGGWGRGGGFGTGTFGGGGGGGGRGRGGRW